MIFSRSCEYGIRALVVLAQKPDGHLMMAKQIAEETGAPAYFLAKLLQSLVRAGLLRSLQGPSGGFALEKPARQIYLIEIVEALNPLEDVKRCPLGNSRCTDRTGCSMHDGWNTLRSRMMDYLESTTLAEISAKPPKGGSKRKVSSGR